MPSFFDGEGKLSPSAFHFHHLKNGVAEDDISMIRKEAEGAESLLNKLASKPPREPGDKFCGIAEILTGAVKNIFIPSSKSVQISVEAKDSKAPHASIRFMLDNVAVNANTNSTLEFLMFAKKLSLMAEVKLA